MSTQIKANYEQDFLLPPSLEDWISKDHPSRYIREFVESLDLKEMGFKVMTNDEGRPYYSSDLLLKLWLYGYYQRIRSSRKLEIACKENISLIWLSGMNYPDHNTFWRFWHENKLRIRNLFKESVKTAVKLELVSMVLNALDGTKIKAKSSNSGVINKKKLEEVLKNLDETIDQMEKEIELNEETEEGEYSLPSELQDKEKMRERIKEALEELKEIKRENMNPKEKEARLMRNSGKKELSYNAQAVVDEKHQILVGMDLINNENDAESLVSMIDEVLLTTSKTAEVTLADSGYATAEQLSEASIKKYNILLNVTEKSNISTGPRKDKPYHVSNFKYDESKDVMICPESKGLKFFEIDSSKNKRFKVRKYKCKDYEDCPMRWECSKSKTGREVKLNPFYKIIEKQIEYQKLEINKEKLKRRKGLIEPIFALVKEIDGFRRFTVKGIEKAKTQWSMICTTVNLKKMYKFWAKGEIKFT
jgi:transposase